MGKVHLVLYNGDHWRIYSPDGIALNETALFVAIQIEDEAETKWVRFADGSWSFDNSLKVMQRAVKRVGNYILIPNDDGNFVNFDKWRENH